MKKAKKTTERAEKTQKFTFTGTKGDSIVIEATNLEEATAILNGGKIEKEKLEEEVETSENIDE